MPDAAEVDGSARQRRRRWKIFFELFILTLAALIIISALHWFVLEPFVVSGDSMVPSFSSGQYLVIDEVTYYFHKPQRGDVIVFRYPLDPSQFFIKRLIGIPGDTVTIAHGVVSVRPKGSDTAYPITEPYVAAANRKDETSTITLSDDEYFVLGDNRNASFDSRTWGPVPGRYIIGQPVLRIFPLQTFTLFPGAYHFSLIATGTPVLSTGTR